VNPLCPVMAKFFRRFGISSYFIDNQKYVHAASLLPAGEFDSLDKGYALAVDLDRRHASKKYSENWNC
jgi:hypothetical protein